MSSLGLLVDRQARFVDPAAVSFRTLSFGARLPAIGLGTFGSYHASHSAVAEADPLTAGEMEEIARADCSAV